MSTERWSFQKVRRPLLFLCGLGIDSEDTAWELFEGAESITCSIGIDVWDLKVLIRKDIAYATIYVL